MMWIGKHGTSCSYRMASAGIKATAASQASADIEQPLKVLSAILRRFERGKKFLALADEFLTLD